MKDVSKLTASEILSILIPEKLFTNPDSVKQEYKKLASLWHTDTHPGIDPRVIAKIGELYALAERKIIAGTWKVEGLLKINTIDGKVYELRYHRHRAFELGDMYIGDNSLVYLVTKDATDLVANSKRIIRDFKYADDGMKKEMSRFLPEAKLYEETTTHHLIVYNKTPDVFSLRDVLNQQGGKLPPTHVAWVLSRLYNISCFLKYNNLSHNDISLDTCFMSPQYHTVVVLGGWWYSTKIGKPLVALTSRAMKFVPASIIESKESSLRVDSELIKATGRELLGDIYGSKLIRDPSIPKPLLNWLQTPGSEKPFGDYETWSHKVLKQSFGERRFVKLDLSASDIYSNL